MARHRGAIKGVRMNVAILYQPSTALASLMGTGKVIGQASNCSVQFAENNSESYPFWDTYPDKRSKHLLHRMGSTKASYQFRTTDGPSLDT